MTTNLEFESLSAREIETQLESAVGKSRADLLNQLSTLTLKDNKDLAEEISSEALDLSRRIGYRRGQGEAYFGLGDVTRTNEQYRSALEHYSSALNHFQILGDSIQQGRCFRRLGDVQFYVNNLNLSLKHYLNALKFFEKSAAKDRTPYARINLGHLMATIGNVLRNSNDLEAALSYYKKCHAIYVREGFIEGIPGILYNTGNVYHSQGRLDESLRVYKQTLEEAELRDDKYLASMALTSLGSVYMARNELDDAESFFKRSMTLSEKLGRKRGILSVSIKLIELGRTQGNLDEAMTLSESAETLAEELNDRKSLRDILREKAHIYRSKSQFEKALETNMICHQIAEEFLSENRVRELDILRVRYETEAKEWEIERLRREKTTQQKMITAAAAGLVLAGVSLVLFYRNVRFRTRVNRELKDAYSRAERLSRVDTLTGLANRRAMMRSLSEEQTRSSRTARNFGLVMADIDSFKLVNDHHGHACGDEVLKEVAKRLKRSLRNQDVASRWGGEEFLLLLPETSLQRSIKVAEKIRSLVERTPFQWKNVSIHLSMTFGVSVGGLIPVDEAIQLADSALYTGKSEGKNRVSSLPYIS